MPRLTKPVEDTPQAKAQAYHILRVAVIEAIAILGLMLFFLNGNLTHLWWFLGGALALLVVIYHDELTVGSEIDANRSKYHLSGGTGGNMKPRRTIPPRHIFVLVHLHYLR